MTLYFGIIIVFFNGQLIPMVEPFDDLSKCRAEVREVSKPLLEKPQVKVLYTGCVKSDLT